MKTAAILSLFTASASAFTPTPAAKASTSLNVVPAEYNPALDDMVGSTIETGGKPWDPLGVSNYVPPEYARAAELANGRSAMLATVGYVFPKYFWSFEGSVTVDDPIAAIGQADNQWWAQFILLCGTLEGMKYKAELEGKTSTYGEGEPVLDWAGMYPADEAGRKKIQEQELKNGRLAMLGIAGFVSAHFIPGSVPISPGF